VQTAECRFINYRQELGLKVHGIALVKNLKQLCISVIAAFLLLTFVSPSAQAEIPPLKFWFYNGGGFNVASRSAACNLLPTYLPYLSNPRVRPGWDSTGRWVFGNPTFDCFYYWARTPTEIYPNDIRTPGNAYCESPNPLPPGGIAFAVDKTEEKCGCSPTQSFYAPEVGSCIKKKLVTDRIPSNPGDNCDTCPKLNVGEPINPATGNMWHIERDYISNSASSGLSLIRTYNSNPYNWDAATQRKFGVRWSQAYDAILQPEASYAVNSLPRTCWQREDTQQIWCELAPRPAMAPIPPTVSIARGDGKKYLFNLSGNAWIGDADTNDRLYATFNADNTAVIGWTYVSAKGDSKETFGADGLLTAITARNGTTQRLTYSDGATNDSAIGRYPADAPACVNVQAGGVLPAGRLLCVTDQWGHQLQFEYDSKGRIVKVIDPSNQSYSYEYDGPSGGCPAAGSHNAACLAGNLTKVTYPGGSSRTYFYNEKAQINGGATCSNARSVSEGFGHLLNSWTGLVDENDVRHISWTYDCQGRATSSQLGEGANKVAIVYGAWASTFNNQLISSVGSAASPQTTTVMLTNTISSNDRARITNISAICADCSGPKSSTYDANGNTTSKTDWNTNVSCYSYDLSRNLEIARLEGSTSSCLSLLGSATTLSGVARKTSTQWHPTFRLPVAIAEAKKRTNFTYDENGNLLVKTEQATSDASGIQGFSAAVVGAARTWTYSYNTLGQILTVTGPRTDALDRTIYTYDSSGNLASITNAMGHVTNLSAYDANGRVGRITDPNGKITNFSYSQRGWLLSLTVQADGKSEVTNYDYDGAGQLIKLSLPDQSSISYTYDNAHRLVGIADSLGNKIEYTLDVRGNRTSERTIDPNGVLARQILRTFDTTNRLKAVTGAPQ
jgi:YD repeat-containing protein